jgi:hypothetical protein
MHSDTASWRVDEAGGLVLETLQAASATVQHTGVTSVSLLLLLQDHHD